MEGGDDNNNGVLGSDSSCNENGGVFELLPEGCIANVVSFTTPLDACRMSLVSRTVKSGSESDSVWDEFLPANYQEIIAGSINPHLISQFSSKKELYLHLCDHPLIVDGGKKSFSLDKSSGKICYTLAARDLKIEWGDTPMYWTWTSLPESRFTEVAVLGHVWWLEIRGWIESSMLSSDTTYGAYLVFKFRNSAYGFANPPAEASFGISGTEMETHFVYLVSERRQTLSEPALPPYAERQLVPEPGSVKYPKRRQNGWLEIELGEFANRREESEELEMSLMEVKGGVLKCGLIVEGIEIRPM